MPKECQNSNVEWNAAGDKVLIARGHFQFAVGSARCADRTPQRGVPTISGM